MRNVIEVRVIQDNGELSKATYTYTVDANIPVETLTNAYLPMRGKDVNCVITDIYYGDLGEKVLDELSFPKDKVVHLDIMKVTLGASI